MRNPRHEPMTRIVPLGAQFGRRSAGARDALGGALVVAREGDPRMAIVQDSVVLALRIGNLVERLCDQETADAIAGLVGERALEKVEPPEYRKFVEHHQELVTALFVTCALQTLDEPAPDLIEHEAQAALVAAEASNAETIIAAFKRRIEKLRRELYNQRSEHKARLLDQLELQLEELEASASEDDPCHPDH